MQTDANAIKGFIERQADKSKSSNQNKAKQESMNTRTKQDLKKTPRNKEQGSKTRYDSGSETQKHSILRLKIEK